MVVMVTGTMVVFFCQAKPEEMESKAEHGLIKGHAYCITDVRKVCRTCIKSFVNG